MDFDMRALPLAARYKIVTSTITPRPIAWVTSRSAPGESGSGVVNAAPYSFFNAVGAEPPLIVLGLLKNLQTRALKDTARNILETGEFVVNLVCEADAEQMNLSSVDAPPGVSEIDYAGIATAPSIVVACPRIATSPVSFECRKLAALDIGTHQTVLIAEILIAHIADEFVSNPEKFYFDTPAMKLIGRTHGSGWYARTSDQFELVRPTFDLERAARASFAKRGC